MKKTIETSFKRIETKYIVAKDDVKDLIKDLKEYVVEDDYPTSTISNIYFDTENFDVIQDALAKQHRREKIRMLHLSLRRLSKRTCCLSWKR